MQTCQSSLPRRGNKGEIGGEGQKEPFFGVGPPIPAFLSSAPVFLVGESFIPPMMLCVGAGWEGGCMVSQVVFLHAFLIKKKEKNVYSFSFFYSSKGEK